MNESASSNIVYIGESNEAVPGRRSDARRQTVILVPLYCNTNRGILQTLFCIFLKNFHNCTIRRVTLVKPLCILLFLPLDEHLNSLSDLPCQMRAPDPIRQL